MTTVVVMMRDQERIIACAAGGRVTPASSEKVKNAKLRAARYFALRGGDSMGTRSEVARSNGADIVNFDGADS